MSIIDLQYAGITINLPRIRPQMQTVWSPSGRTIRYQVLTLTIRGWIYHIDIQAKGSTWQETLAQLNSQGQTFSYTENGQNVMLAMPVGKTGANVSQGVQYYDVDYGPKGYCHIIQNNPASIEVELIVSITIAPQNSLNLGAIQSMAPAENTQYQAVINNISQGDQGSLGLYGSLIDMVMDVTYNIDESGYEIRTISGELTIPGNAGSWDDYGAIDSDSWRFAALNMNRFLGISILNPPPYYERTQQTWRILADRKTMVFMVQDTQVDWVPPNPCTQYDATVIVHDHAGNELGTLEKTVAIEFSLPPVTAQIISYDGPGSNHGPNNTTGKLLATDVKSAITNQQDAAMAIVLQSMNNFVINQEDQNMKVFISDFEMTRVSYRRNMWRARWECVLTKSVLYSGNGFSKLGLFDAPPNSAPVYGAPGPYGFDGLRGSAYTAGQNQQLGLYLNQGNWGKTTSSSSASLMEQEVINQEGSAMHNEMAYIEYETAISLFGVGGASSIGQKIFEGIPVLFITGYKGAIVNMSGNSTAASAATTPGDKGEYPTAPTPDSYFKIVTSFAAPGTSGSTPPPTGTSNTGVNTDTKLSAMVAYQHQRLHKAIPSKLGNTWFLITEYSMVLYIDPAVANKLNSSGTSLATIIPSQYTNAKTPSVQTATPNKNIAPSPVTPTISQSKNSVH